MWIKQVALAMPVAEASSVQTVGTVSCTPVTSSNVDMEKELLVTDGLKSNAKGNKAIGILTMGCFQFLELTVRGTVSHFIGTEKKQYEKTKGTDSENGLFPLAQYNEWVRQREIRVMPFLRVDKTTGMVNAHEGRHRAAAVLEAGGHELQVAIILADRGYAEYYEEPFIEDYSNPKQFFKRYLGIQDVPARFLGQFDSSFVRVKPLKPGDWEPFYTKQQTEMPVTAGTPYPRPVSDFYKRKGA
jgi:hypothetical protein